MFTEMSTLSSSCTSQSRNEIRTKPSLDILEINDQNFKIQCILELWEVSLFQN